MKLPQIATRSIGSSKFFVQNNAPTILTGAGVIGFIATTALTVRATTRAVERLPRISKNVQETKVATEGAEKKEKARELTRVYFKSSVELLEDFWPPLVVGSASIVCLISAHNIMLKRQGSLVAAYTALDAGYKAYRSRVKEFVGEEKEAELYHAPTMIDSIDGEGLPCQILDEDADGPSPYARFFDQSSRNWKKTGEYNLMFLRAQEQWANDRLRAYGYLFLNEVYEALDLERSQAGQAVGWRADADARGTGDGFVSFGLYNSGDEGSRTFINLIEPIVLLDFNVDGLIRIPR